MAGAIFAQAHPRSRGENRSGGASPPPSGGSSPLTRGKLHARGLQSARSRLIPAHVGKTSQFRPRRGWSGAHPRSRGENVNNEPMVVMVGGSSPLTWGKHRERGLLWYDPGLIPAHVGKTKRMAAVSQRIRAHPRSRGENQIKLSHAQVGAGSSPLTWGKHVDRGDVLVRIRLIPAHVGKTASPRSSSEEIQAHPRSRGENQALGYPARRPVGSSPLTRGKSCAGSGAMVMVRLIPAHAGKITVPEATHANSQAHPRSRGENVWSVVSVGMCGGSSPLTRGKCHAALSINLRPGLIPAHAGKMPQT